MGDDRALHRHTTPPPTRTIAGDGCTVEYTAGYFRDRDHFQFTGPGTPPQPIPLSGTGHWSHFADPDAVIALDGPEAYVAALSAVGRDGAKAFEEAFVGKLPEPGRGRRSLPVVGEHTAKVVAPPVRETTRSPVIDPTAEERNLFTQADEPGHDR